MTSVNRLGVILFIRRCHAPCVQGVYRVGVLVFVIKRWGIREQLGVDISVLYRVR